MSRITPISAMMVKVLAGGEQRQQRPHARGGERGQNGQRVHETLIENAEHQVHGDECRQDEQRLIAERVLERLAVP